MIQIKRLCLPTKETTRHPTHLQRPQRQTNPIRRPVLPSKRVRIRSKISRNHGNRAHPKDDRPSPQKAPDETVQDQPRLVQRRQEGRCGQPLPDEEETGLSDTTSSP